MKTKEPSEEFKAQVSDYVPKKRKRPWSLPPISEPSNIIDNTPVVEKLETSKPLNSFGNRSVHSENQSAKTTVSPLSSQARDAENLPSDNQLSGIQNTKNQIAEKQSSEIKISENKNTEKQQTGIQNTDNQISKKQYSEYQITEKQNSDFQITEKPSFPKPTKKPRLQNVESENVRAGELGISYGGFMPLNCLIFDQSIFVELKPGEFKLYIYLLFLAFRYPERKNHVRAAITYLVAGTGMKKDAVIAHLKRLSELRIAECVEQNQKLGNLYLINTTYLWSAIKPSSEIQNTGNKSTDKTTADGGFSDGSTLEIRKHHSDNQTQDNTLLKNITLSQGEEGNFIQDYLASLPQGKLKREREAFLSLTNNYKISDIKKALEHINIHGELKTGESCHSPLSYLSLAMNDVLKRMNDAQKKSRGSEPNYTDLAVQEKARELEQQKQDEEFKLKETAFLKNFATEEERISQIEKIIEGLPFKTSGELARRIAITTWWEKNQ